MKLQRFKENNKNQKVILIFTIACVLLITGVFLYKTFASFQVIENEDMINGSISNPGDVYFAFYVDNKITKTIPQKGSGYVLDEKNSYCGVLGEKDESIKPILDEEYNLTIKGVTTTKTKCHLYFVKGIYILGKGIPFAFEGEDGLYEITHDEVNGTINDQGFQQTEYRYVGKNPNNYIKFNDEDWRIIGLVNVLTTNGTVEQRVKIVKNESIGAYSWDTTVNDGLRRGENKWYKADLMTLLNDYYYYSKVDQQCWVDEGNLKTKQISCSFDGVNGNIKGLQNVHNMIDENIIWTLGEKFATNITTPEAYQKERIVNNDDSKWPNETSKSSFHSIGLMYPSDYGYAYGNRDCTKNNPLGTQNNPQCYETNWFSVDKLYRQWFLTASIKDNFKVQSLSEGKYLYDGVDAYGASHVHPVLYLKPTVKIIDGSGISTDTYILE